jgi:hypothetical protein
LLAFIDEEESSNEDSRLPDKVLSLVFNESKAIG